MFKNGKISRVGLEPSPKFKEAKVKKKKRADVAEIVEQEFGKYQIKAGRLSGAYIARAFPKPPAKSQGLIAESKGETEEAAIAALKLIIEARDVRRTKERRWEERSSLSVPNEEEFVEALLQVRLSQAQVAMFKSHALSGEEGLTFAQMAIAAGYKSRDTTGKIYNKAGALIADYLGVEFPDRKSSNSDGAAQVLAFERDQEEDAPAIWIMHQELRNAIRATL